MAYSTGSGTYTDLMAAVLAHANTDGWTLTGGDWPISKGNVRGVDWSTFTDPDTDWTSGAGVPHTTRWIRIAVGSSGADATANAAGGTGNRNAAFVPNMEYNIDQWHIFSDPGAGKPDYIHVVIQFSNGTDPQVFGHFSFGEIDKHGMGYGSVAYASGHPCRGFSPATNSNTSRTGAWDSNLGVTQRIHRIFTGRLGWSWSIYDPITNVNPICYMVHPTNSPFPTTPIWPQPDVIMDHTRVLDTYGPHSSAWTPNNPATSYQGTNAKISFQVLEAGAQPYSGGISLGPIPLFIANTTSNSSTLQFMSMGSFPNVRLCNLTNFIPGDEVVFGSDTWVLFPFLRRTDRSVLGESTRVTSGPYGLAYKKVT